MCTIESIDDILEDIEATAAASKIKQKFDIVNKKNLEKNFLKVKFFGETLGFSKIFPKITEHMIERKVKKTKPGWALISLCGSDTKTRYRTLLFYESIVLPDHDYGMLINSACVMMEAELNKILIEPAKKISGELITPLQNIRKYHSQYDLLNRWASGEIKTTIGIGILVLLALRKGLEQNNNFLLTFLKSIVSDAFIEGISNKSLGSCLETIRNEFRNPSCHGVRVFNETDYLRFVDLMVSNSDFKSWDSSGMKNNIGKKDGLSAKIRNFYSKRERHTVRSNGELMGGIFHFLLEKNTKIDTRDLAALKMYNKEWEKSITAN